MKLSNDTYDKLKWVAQIALPALGTLYFAIAKIWGLPFGAEFVGTVAAVDTFLGALLGLSTNRYNKDLNISGKEVTDEFDDEFNDEE